MNSYTTHGARKGLADTALKTANSGYPTEDWLMLLKILWYQLMTVYRNRCSSRHIEGGEVVEGLRERIFGRVLADDLYQGEEVLVPAGTLLTTQ